MEDPQTSLWIAQITTQFPGASAERVESLVTEKIEQKLLEIEEINSISSTSHLGSSSIIVELKDTVENFDRVWSNVRQRLTDVTKQLPREATDPEIEDIYLRSNTLIVALTWESSDLPNYAILRRLSEHLKEQLYTIGNIEKIELWGAPSEEILVEINSADLAVLGLTVQQLSQQIHLSDAKVSSGVFRSSKNDFLIEVETALDSLERIRQIPINVGKNSSQLVRLGDIASITKGIHEPPSELAIINGKPGIVLALRTESSQRIDQWMKRANQTLEEFSRSKPQGIGLELLLDQNHYVKTALDDLFRNLWLGTFLVIVSTAFLMGVRSALVIGFSLPLSVMMVFCGMNYLKVPLDNSSVTGLVIALGMLIDNAIVVVDEMDHLLREGYSFPQAVPKTVRYLAIPLLASTLTTVLSFVPILLAPGATGEFVHSLALSVILALSSSLFLSLTVIPALNGWITPKTTKLRTITNKKNFWKGNLYLPKLTKVYGQVLISILKRPILGVLLTLVLPVTGFLMAANVPQQFFPLAERDQFYIELELFSSASIEQTKSVVEEATEVIRQYPEVTNLSWFIGTSTPSFYYTILPTGIKGGRNNYAAAMVQTNSVDESRQIISDLQQELNVTCPSAKILVKQLESGPPTPPIEIRIYGSDLNILRKLGNHFRVELTQVANITHTSASLEEVFPKLALSLNEQQVRLTGLDNTQIAEQINASLEGKLGGSILEENEELPLRVRLSTNNQGNFNQIATHYLLPNNTLNGDSSSQIPLSSLGKLSLVPEVATITRRNSKRVNIIKGFVKTGILTSTVLADFKEQIYDTDFQFPLGYSIEFGGEVEAYQRAVGNLMTLVVPSLLLVFATLVLSFNSFRCTVIVYMVAISSIGLGLGSLWLFGYPLSFVAICGIVGLIGVAINDSIVVLASLRAHPQAKKGDIQAMAAIIIRSTRHVLTTTITTVVGFMPLFLDGGEYWPPMSICLAGGITGATLLALFFVPCAYLLVISKNYTGFKTKSYF